MPSMLFFVAATLITLLAGLGVSMRWRRHRAVARLTDVRRLARGATVRVTIVGTNNFFGFDPSRLGLTIGDLALTDREFVLATNRGVLVSLDTEERRRFTSARCTGPGRLVLEGDLPQASDRPAHYRLEVAVDEAEQWAEALIPFVAAPAEGRRFATRPPVASTS